MSLLANINLAIDQNLDTFILRIIKQFNISSSKEDIKQLWNSESKSTFDMSKILSASKQELVAECKKRNLKVSGKKSELVARLTGKTHEKKTPEKKKSPKIIDKIKKCESKVIQIRKNKFGNYEHADTKFILDKDTQKVIGLQNDDGSIDPLTDAHVDLCNKFKFAYDLSKSPDEKIEELNSDFSEEDFFSDD